MGEVVLNNRKVQLWSNKGEAIKWNIWITKGWKVEVLLYLLQLLQLYKKLRLSFKSSSKHLIFTRKVDFKLSQTRTDSNFQYPRLR